MGKPGRPKKDKRQRHDGKLPPGVVPIAEEVKNRTEEVPAGGEVVLVSGKKFQVTPAILELKEEYDKLTKLQRNWFDAYIINRDGTQSAKIAGYKGDNPTLAHAGTMNKRKMQPMIDIMDSFTQEIAGIVTELTGIYEFWGGVIGDSTQFMRDRLKASELLARALGAFDGENGNTNFNFYSEKFDQIPQETLEAFIIKNSEKQ